MKFLQVLVILLLVINLLTLGLVIGPKFFGPKRGIKQQFDFDKTQMMAFEKSRKEIRSKLDELNPMIKEISKDYYALEEEGEEGAKMLEEIGRLNKEVYRAHLNHFQDLREISTDEQRKKIPGFIDRLMNNGAQKKPRRPGGQNGPPERRG